MVEESVGERLNWKDLLAVLIGRRAAIERAAGSNAALVIGACLVVAGGFARSYDHAYLLAEPWMLVRGFPVTIMISGSIFLLVLLSARRQGVPGEARENPWRGYLRFLRVYWLTAPMAWLYAIPYERFTDAGAAMTANLWTLAFVSAWRVLLVSRIVSVLFRAPVAASFFVVMLACEAAAGAALFLYDGPTIAIMSGAKMPPQDEILADTAFWVGALVVVTAPLWLVAGLIGLWWLRPALDRTPDRATSGVGWSAVAFVSLPFVVLGAASAMTQPEQRRRSEAEALLFAGRVEEAVQFMRRVPRDALPPHWDPPPRWAWRDTRPTESELVVGLRAVEWDSWAAEDLGRKLEAMCFPRWMRQQWTRIRGNYLEIVDGRPVLTGRASPCSHVDAMRLILAKAPWLSEEDRATIRLILQACETAGDETRGAP